MNVSGNVYVNGRLVVDSSGNLYDGGQAIKNIYSSKTDAGTMYAKWDNEIAQLRSSLSGIITHLIVMQVASRAVYRPLKQKLMHRKIL
ncbi:hypothetical protein K04M1_52090 (plasmid) [Vibrio alginolyticus]|nr:hypothetical protein K04M1_52090 [Vibrio alginolyticus]